MTSAPKAFWDDWSLVKVLQQILLVSCFHFLLIALAIPIWLIEFMINGKVALYVISNAWTWIFATPLRILGKLGLYSPNDVGYLLFICISNSLLYGIFWWFCYRMFRLMFARKAAE